MFRSSSVVGFALVVLSAIACSSGTGTTGGGEPVPLAQLGQKYAEKICPAIAGCCSQNGFAEEHKRCMDIAPRVQAEAEKDLKDGVTYDAQRAGNCLAKLASAISTCNSTDALDDDQDCENIFNGTKGAGEACTSSNQCKDGRCYGIESSSSGETKPGKCVITKSPAAAGDACFVYDDAEVDTTKVYSDCGYADTLYCDAESKTCKAKGGAGTSCVRTVNLPSGGTATTSDSSVCDKTSYCDYQTKKCEARKAAGEACASTGGGECVETAYCDAAKKCVTKHAAGEPCGESGGECQYGCDSKTKKCRVNRVARDMCAGEDAD